MVLLHVAILSSWMLMCHNQNIWLYTGMDGCSGKPGGGRRAITFDWNLFHATAAAPVTTFECGFGEEQEIPSKVSSFLVLVTFQFEEAHGTVRLLMSGRQRACFWLQLLMFADQCGRSAIVDIVIGYGYKFILYNICKTYAYAYMYVLWCKMAQNKVTCWLEVCIWW